MMKKRRMELNGEELWWVLKLAREHFDSEEFRRYLNIYKRQELQKSLHLILGQLDETIFYASSLEDTWILTNDEEDLHRIKGDGEE